MVDAVYDLKFSDDVEGSPYAREMVRLTGGEALASFEVELAAPAPKGEAGTAAVHPARG